MKTETKTISEPTTLPIETVEEAASKRYTYTEFKTAFKRGVNWQKQQDEKRYNTLLESHNKLLKTLDMLVQS